VIYNNLGSMVHYAISGCSTG